MRDKRFPPTLLELPFDIPFWGLGPGLGALWLHYLRGIGGRGGGSPDTRLDSRMGQLLVRCLSWRGRLWCCSSFRMHVDVSHSALSGLFIPWTPRKVLPVQSLDIPVRKRPLVRKFRLSEPVGQSLKG